MSLLVLGWCPDTIMFDLFFHHPTQDGSYFQYLKIFPRWKIWKLIKQFEWLFNKIDIFMIFQTTENKFRERLWQSLFMASPFREHIVLVLSCPSQRFVSVLNVGKLHVQTLYWNNLSQKSKNSFKNSSVEHPYSNTSKVFINSH
jgi:hypothetical protein